MIFLTENSSSGLWGLHWVCSHPSWQETPHLPFTSVFLCEETKIHFQAAPSAPALRAPWELPGSL